MLPQDKGQVGAFSDKIQFSGRFTSNRDDLIGALKDLQFGNPTRLYDAIVASIDVLNGVEGRKIVLVFTDGDNTASRRDMGDALAKARETGDYDLRHRSGVGVCDRSRAYSAHAARSRPAQARRRNRRWILRTEKDRRTSRPSHASPRNCTASTRSALPPTVHDKEHKLEVKMNQAGRTRGAQGLRRFAGRVQRQIIHALCAMLKPLRVSAAVDRGIRDAK